MCGGRGRESVALRAAAAGAFDQSVISGPKKSTRVCQEWEKKMASKSPGQPERGFAERRIIGNWHPCFIEHLRLLSAFTALEPALETWHVDSAWGR